MTKPWISNIIGIAGGLVGAFGASISSDARWLEVCAWLLTAAWAFEGIWWKRMANKQPGAPPTSEEDDND
jgi:hypothetical protein